MPKTSVPAAGTVIDVGEVLENRKLGGFQLLTLAFAFAILFVDGLDYSAANVGAPAILRAFHAEKSAMGAVFGWGYFGILLGSLAFGYLGDRYGRKTGAVLGVLAYSVPAALTVFAHSLDTLMVFRFLACLGIGGVVPNIIALLTETAPKRYRVTFVMLAFVGYSTGNAAIAQIAARLIPAHGWQVVFLTAGVAGLGLGLLLAWVLPESIPFLAARRSGDPRLPRLLARAAPECAIGPQTRFVLRQPIALTRFNPRQLFAGGGRVATPILWIAFFAESLTYMTLSAWLAVLLEQGGLTPKAAALAFSYAALGAVAAVFVLARLIDRFGPRACVLSAVSAMAAIVALGVPGLSTGAMTAIAILAIACAGATHNALNGLVGLFYPTLIRGNGIGFATGMGRVAAIAGPVIAGYLLSMNLPLADVLAAIAAPYAAVAAAVLVLNRLVARHGNEIAAEGGVRALSAGSSDLPTGKQPA